MDECYEQIISHVNVCTIIDKDTILDVFVEKQKTAFQNGGRWTWKPFKK